MYVEFLLLITQKPGMLKQNKITKVRKVYINKGDEKKFELMNKTDNR